MIETFLFLRILNPIKHRKFSKNIHIFAKYETVVTIQSILETIPRLQRMLLGRQLWLAAESSARTQI